MAPDVSTGCCKASKFPKSIFFVLGNELCERFSYYGIRSVLILYLTKKLLIDRPSAMTLYHSFAMLNYFMPLFGGLLADVYVGKYKTILFVSFIYSAGNVFLSLTAVPQIPLNPRLPYVVVALLIIAIGAGGIKPCVSAFGGDQFEKGQEDMRDKYFSVFYFCINLGAMLSMILSPIFRAEVQCLGEMQCYPLAFGFPAVLMIAATIIFVAGTRMYKIYPPQGNAVLGVVQCIWRALRNRCKATEKRSHWLDHADDKFDPPFIDEVKTVLGVLLLFVPLPMFWALFDQQGSTWTLQSAMMDGRVAKGVEIQPDQMDSLNAMLVILFIPLFAFIVYPLLGKCRLLRTPLQKMCTGGFFTAVAFVIGGFLQLLIERHLPEAPSVGHTDLMVVNTLNCPIVVSLKDFNHNLKHYESYTYKEIAVKNPIVIKVSMSVDCPVPAAQRPEWEEFEIVAESEKAYTVAILLEGGILRAEQAMQYRTRHKKAKSFIRFIHHGAFPGPNLLVNQDIAAESDKNETDLKKHQWLTFEKNGSFSTYADVWPMKNCDVCWTLANSTKCINNERIGSFNVYKGGTFDVILSLDSVTNKTNMVLLEAVRVDNLHILHQVPQYVLITMGEVMLSVTGLSFAYSQAPPGMKAVLQAAWLLTVAFGNLIVILIEQVKQSLNIHKESTSFFAFATMMAIDMCLFSILAIRYKYKAT